MWQAISYYGALAIQSLVGVVGIRLYEEPRFDIVGSLKNGIEIRRYDPRLAAEVEIAQVGDAGRDEAFRLLFAYIAGANRTSALANERVAMTVPVDQADQGGGVQAQSFGPQAVGPADDPLRIKQDGRIGHRVQNRVNNTHGCAPDLNNVGRLTRATRSGATALRLIHILKYV